MSQDLSIYLSPTEVINSDHPVIRELTAGQIDPADPPKLRAMKLFRFVRDKIRYNPFAPMLELSDYVATTVWERGFGYCTQKAVLLATLARCAQVPTKLCLADIINHQVTGDLLTVMGTNLFTWHGFVAFYLDGDWVKATPAFDLPLCEKHGFAPIDFDGETNAVFHPVDPEGAKHIEYVKDLGCYADLPFDDIIRSFVEVYGKGNQERVETWMKGKGV